MKDKLRLVLICAFVLPAIASAFAEERRPNVLFVSVDDLNDWIEPLRGHPQAMTPNFTRFAKRSVCFTNANCPSPGCNPSRTAIMTGLAPYTSGVYSNYQDWREAISNHQTIGAYFRQQGYFSSGAGKIFHYHMVDPECWDEYWPSQQQNMPDDALPDFTESRLATADKPTPATMNMPAFDQMYGAFDWSALDIADEEMGDFKSVDYVLGQLNKPRDKPLFLACGIYRPHLPWYVPGKYFDMFPLDEVVLPKRLENDLADVGPRVRDIASRGGGYHQHVVEAGQWKRAVQGYLASIAFADAMFGRLLDGLDESGQRETTIIVLWSDHGWQLGEKQHWRKFALWDNVVRSVLMIHVPKNAPGLPDGSADGQRCHRPVSLQDIYPTLVDLCGLPTNNQIDGHRLTPLLEEPEGRWDHVALTTYDFGEFSVRSERYRYTRYIDGSEELYDHQSDAEEWHNLAGDPNFAQIKNKLAAQIPESPAPLVKTSEKLDPHHIPPFRSRSEYDEWLQHGKDNQYLLNKYWQ
ncbi:sulfatase [Allorhodopirellula solitaria]|uniref:sulfatase n=1 Tax=Allorhodopirellula solitaria TaxID=2527987 RepID=UPI0016473B1D|nr:sulfatase [Allorhodopirellula solitaria]